MISSNYQILIIIIIGIIIIFLLFKPSENFTTTPLLATEACQNVASTLLNSNTTADNITANNITATGTLTLGTGANKWIFSPSTVDGNNQLIIAPLNASNNLDSTKQFALYHDENTIVTNNAMNIKNIKTENLSANILTTQFMHNEGAMTIGPKDNKWMWYPFKDDDNEWLGFSPVDEKNELKDHNGKKRIFNFLRNKDELWTNFGINNV